MKFKISILTLLFSFGILFQAKGQIDSSLIKRIPKDTSFTHLNMDAVYNRPFLSFGKMPVALGGYVEVNWQHLSQDGISDGHQLQLRRMTIFVASAIGKRIKFLSEIEFEEGGKEIGIEFAAVDFEFHSLAILRAGIFMNPIGAFNQNHDGPKWEFTNRPICATQMLPATWSNSGFGFYGKHNSHKWMFGYEFYLSGGFDNSIIENSENKTFLPAAKANPERFEDINSGIPMVTGKLAIRHKAAGELGLSYMGQVYNKFEDDGIAIDSKRRVDVIAIDYNNIIPKLNTFITGEFAWVLVDVPATYSQQFGSKQQGFYLDIVQPVIDRKIFAWKDAVFNLACRFEYVDWNVGSFVENGANIHDEIWSITPAVSFRPVPQTVLRLNYQYQKQRDLLGNPPATTGGFSFGISSYF